MNNETRAREIIEKVEENNEMIVAVMYQGEIILDIISEVTYAKEIETNGTAAFEIGQYNDGQFIVSDFLEYDFELSAPANKEEKEEWQEMIFDKIVYLYSDNY